MATATGTIQQDVIHHQNTVTLHHLGSLAQLKTDGSLFAYTVSTDNSEDLILYHSQNNGTMDFLLEGDNGGSSRESIANLLDEGLGTSLDGTDEISSSIHSTLGRNDSGVFSSDEMTTSPPNNGTQNNATTTATITNSASITTPVSNNSIDVVQSVKKQRQKNSSPNRQGPQRCVVCGKIFSNASALTKHKLTHSDERKHACSMCGKAFKRQDHLNGHMLTHRNKKPFECRAKGCGKSYCDGRSLRRHIESRHGPEALATLTIQPTAINPPNSDVTLTVSSSVSTNGGTTTTSAGSNIGGTVVDHLKLSDNGSQESELVMETNGVTASILGLDSNLLENNFVGQPMDIQVALQPVIVKEEKQTGSAVVASASGTPTATAAIKLEPIQITDSSQMLGLTLSTANGTLCGIVGGGDAAKLRNSIAVPSSSVGNNTTAITTTTVPVTIRATHSQLHQLLTQRHSSNVSVGSTAITNASLVTLNPASVTKPQQSDSVGISYEPNWATNENEMTQSKSSGTATGNILAGESTTGTLILGANGKCPSSPISSGVSSSSSSPGAVAAATTTMTVTTSPASAATTTPNLLKEQLELIHQIIQQAQEESNLSATANSATSTKSGSGKASKGTSKKLRAGATSAANSNNGIVIKIEPGDDASKLVIDDKPVECTICCRRFKNTPALNGHMRLHGGYFKKDAEGKKKDVVSTSKESSNTPLQTASVSVRALIEEKIIQKRNTIQTQGVEKSVGSGGNPPTSSSPENQTGYTQTLRETPQENGIPSVGHQEQQQQQQSLDVNVSSTFPTTASTLNITNGVPQTFHFVYGDDNTDYLLMEEEVFNKVSSICPDSFLNGIDESILNGTGVEQLPPEWNWAATSAGVDSANSRLTSLFVGADSSSDPQLQPASTGSFTPLPPLEASFYTSPTPQSPSVNSQDSPSFMYPTPPASLESHNALQSPLFPFPSIPAPQTTPASTVVFPYETKATSSIKTNTSNLSISNPIITNALSTSNMNPTNFIGASGFNQIITAALTSPLVSTEEGPDVNSMNGSLVRISTPSNNTSTVPGVASVILTAVAGDSILTTASTNHVAAATKSSTTTATPTTTLDDITNFTSAKARNLSGGSTSELTILTPSNSPSLGSASADDSLQSVKELKVNEPSRMDCSGDGIGPDIFLSPNSVPNSPCFKSPTKRKQLRNTFASNLRPQTNSPNNSHFTPYPILSPVRSAPGLYWTFSPKLSHVDDSKREVPKINIGSKFQAELPQCNNKKRKLEDCDIQSDEEYRLWRTEVTDTCTSEEVEKYLEFACCSAIPGGGRNKEYALHVLNNCNGDIVDAMVVLMNPCPSLPSNLRKYKYQEKDKWTKDEISIFQEALFRYGKDFTQVAQEIEGKSREECVIFYYLWKKVCSSEYERVRNVWKKRDAAFTLELLKNVPPPSSLHIPSRVSLVNSSNNHGFLDSLHLKSQVPNQITDVSTPSSDNSAGPTHLLSHEEYPCKVCGKVFNKVKSRSAHMKSHRPPESSEGSNSSVNSKKIKIGLPVSTKVVSVGKAAILTASPPPVVSPVADSVSSVSSSSPSSIVTTNHGQTPLKTNKILACSGSPSSADNDITSVNGSNNKDT